METKDEMRCSCQGFITPLVRKDMPGEMGIGEGHGNSLPPRLPQNLKNRTEMERCKVALGRQHGSYLMFVFIVPSIMLRTEYMRKK